MPMSSDNLGSIPSSYTKKINSTLMNWKRISEENNKGLKKAESKKEPLAWGEKVQGPNYGSGSGRGNVKKVSPKGSPTRSDHS
jgi:hypothetical protein